MKKFQQIICSPEWWLVLVPIAAYWQLAFFHSSMKWDMTDQTFVWHRFISECFHLRIIPLWSPYSRLGYPFFADPQSSLFYPVTWFFAYFFHYSLYTNDLEFIFHVVGGAFGMRFLLRTLGISRYGACLVGIIYALSGPYVSNASHVTFIGSLCWLPWILGAYILTLQTTQYRYSILTAIFLFLQLTGGYAGVSFVLVYVLLFMLLYHITTSCRANNIKPAPLILNHALIGIFSILLSVGFLYSISRGFPYMDRTNGLSRTAAGSFAFTPFSFLTFLFPWAGDNEIIKFGTDITMRNLYIGIPALILALGSFVNYTRLRIVIMIGSIFCLATATGVHLPVRGWLYDYVPFMNMFRMAAIFRFFAGIGLLSLAAMTFDELFEKNTLKTIKNVRIILLGALALMMAGILILALRTASLHFPTFESLQAFNEDVRHMRLADIIFAGGLANIALLFLASIILLFHKGQSSLPKYLFTVLAVLDMGFAVQASIFVTVAEPRNCQEVQRNLDQLPPGFPIVPNLPLISFNQWNDSLIAPPLWQNAGFLRKQIAFDGNNSFNLIAYNQLSERKDFYNILKARKFISTNPDSEQVSITRFSPNGMSIRVKTKSAFTMNIGQMYFPGWYLTSSILQQPVELVQDSVHLMKCSAPAGTYTANVCFRPKGIAFCFLYSVAIFIFTVIVIASLFVPHTTLRK